MDPQRAPTCFISYSWDSPEHREWVRRLATELRRNGVDAILDAFHAPLGADLDAFMRRIATCDYVLLVCTPGFREKSVRAEGGAGGIGYEQAIITGQIFSGAARPEKFIPVVRSGKKTESVPDYLLNRHSADFRDDASFEQSLEQLLRAIFRAPAHVAPELGRPPAFVTSRGASEPAPESWRTLFFEAFDADDTDPEAARRYAETWTVGVDPPWSGTIRGGVYRLRNTADTGAVRYGYVGMTTDGAPIDLSDCRASADVRIGELHTGAFTSAGVMFRFDRERRHYGAFVLSVHAGRGRLQHVKRDADGFEMTELAAPLGFNPTGRVNLGVVGRGPQLELEVDGRVIQRVAARAGLRGDPGLIAIGTGEFEFDNFVVSARA